MAIRIFLLLVSLALLGVASPQSVSAGLPETISRVKTSVVAIGTYQKTRSPAFVFRGTGFVVGDGTLVATNAHVLPEQVNTQHLERLVVVTHVRGGEPFARVATVFALDKAHDIAVVRFSGAPLPALKLQDSAAHEGQVFAFTGFPIGNVLGLAPVTHRGMISAITPIALPSANARQLDAKVIRQIQAGIFEVFQLDATAYPGNSGSPLYDIETGAVLGIINMVFVKNTREAALAQPSGITFAVPVVYLRDLLAENNSAVERDEAR
jgi:S1-C subfamily serine protease